MVKHSLTKLMRAVTLSSLRKGGLLVFAIVLALSTFGCDEEESSGYTGSQQDLALGVEQRPSGNPDEIPWPDSEIQPHVTPVPGAVILGAIGIGLTGWKLRKQKTV